MEKFQSSSAEPQPDLAQSLPRDAFYENVRVLRGALPPPDRDAPEDWERRDRAAMAAVAALLPVNAAEARLAALFVKAEAWAGDCLRLAVERRREMNVAHKCRAQALSLMREAKSAWRLLLKAQAERREMEKDEAASDRAAWVEHSAVAMMREGLVGAAAGVGDAAAGADVVTVAPHPDPPHEEEGEGIAAVSPVGDGLGGEDALAGGVWKFGSGSGRALQARGVRSETEPRFRPTRVRSAA